MIVRDIRAWLQSRIRAVLFLILSVISMLGRGDAAQVLYGFDTDEVTRVGDWLSADGAQDAIPLGSFELTSLGRAAFGDKAGKFASNSFSALEIPGTSLLGDSFTLAATISESHDDFSRLFSSYDGGTVDANELLFDVNPAVSGTAFGVRAVVNGTSVARNVYFADSNYHHVALTYDHGQLAMFLDGAQIGPATTVPSTPVTLARNLRFGEDYPPTSQTNEPFSGLADDILVYDRALSPSEILSLKQQGAAALFGAVPPLAAPPPPAIDVGGRIQMFVDDRLVARSTGVSLQLNPPEEKGIALQLNRAYETSASTYFTALKDEQGKVRLYYRGRAGGKEATLMAISNDGVNFSRPNLNVYSHNGSSNNHIVWEGAQSHNMAPFLDTNPAAPPEARWKALGGTGVMYAMQSPDGIHWKLMPSSPLEITGEFDSQNIAFWDAEAEVYRSYSRVWEAGVRAVQLSTSTDFIHWSTPELLNYEVPFEHFYTNGIVELENAEPRFVGVPMRFDPSRTNLPSPNQTGVTDAVFMSSHDGLLWDRELVEPWIEEGYDSTRSNMPAWGILETSDNEWSMYSTEMYLLPNNRLRRLTIRPYGFASVQAGDEQGWFETHPVTFDGGNLVLNFNTGDGGQIAVEVRDKFGVPIPGFTLDDMTPLTGDDLAHHLMWNSGRSLGELAGQEIRLYFELSHSDLYSLQFALPVIAADFDGDGTVDDQDYTVWRRQFGLFGRHSAEGNRDGVVDAADYTVWRDGRTTNTQSSSQIQSVPEPPATSTLVLALALICCACPTSFGR